MVYFFLNMIQKHYSWPLSFFDIGLRSLGGGVMAYVLLWLFGGELISKWRHFLSTGTRPLTPNRHKKKGNVPTMGGIFIIGVILVSTILWCNLANSLIAICVLTMISFGGIGALDDWKKIHYKIGIAANTKSFLQVVCATGIVLLWLYVTGWDTCVYFPLCKNFSINLGCLYPIWPIFIIVGSSNAVNLTDGLDGLAIGSLVPNLLVFILIAYMLAFSPSCMYPFINLPHISELVVFGTIVMGAVLGFLFYNRHPAKIFMGDVGSLALGAIIALFALICKQECLLAISGIIFVIETVSVMLQVFSFKARGKRIFKMAPIHHHFELIGYSESNIVYIFTMTSMITSILAICLFCLY